MLLVLMLLKLKVLKVLKVLLLLLLLLFIPVDIIVVLTAMFEVLLHASLGILFKDS